jgi:uncharacterized protein (TIGR00296 family)
MSQTIAATTDMAAYCFHVLINHLHGKHDHTPISDDRTVGGIFVTWEKNGGLRGCIGCLKELPLSAISEYAVKAGLRDSRFTPIRTMEVPQLHCTVSILHSFEMCLNPYDWIVGKHGVIVEFRLDGETFRSTFLPKVIPEQRWNKEKAIEQAIRKSGFEGKVESIFQFLVVTRYQSSEAKADHSDYICRKF